MGREFWIETTVTGVLRSELGYLKGFTERVFTDTEDIKPYQTRRNGILVTHGETRL